MNRRRFLLGAGGSCIASALAGCGAFDGTARPVSPYRGEFRTIALAAALENQAVRVYQRMLTAAEVGALGAPVPAFTGLLRACLSQHAQHARAWNAILRAAGKPAVAGVPLSGHAGVMRAVGSAPTLDRAAVLAIQLEDQAAQTCVAAVAAMASPAAATVAAGIAPVEAMHAAALRFIAGRYPAPAALGGTAPPAAISLLTA